MHILLIGFMIAVTIVVLVPTPRWLRVILLDLFRVGFYAFLVALVAFGWLVVLKL